MNFIKSIARFFANVKKEMIKFSIATIAIVIFFMLFFTASDAIIAGIGKVFS